MYPHNADPDSPEYHNWVDNVLKDEDIVSPDVHKKMIEDVPRHYHQIWINPEKTVAIVCYLQQELEEHNEMIMWGYSLNNGSIVKEFDDFESPDEDYLSGVPYTQEFRDLWQAIEDFNQLGNDETAMGVMNI